jgi:hypothetical protein
MLRAVAPTAWATASQTADTPRAAAAKPSAMGLGPVRTARGAGRFFAEGRFADEPRLVLLVRVVEGFLPLLRDRVLEPLRPVVRDPDVDVLLLRDPGGEDVRVAMAST